MNDAGNSEAKTSIFNQSLEDNGSPLLADGAMGTMLHTRGVGFDQCFDELNITNPSLVADVHRAYIEAGADVIMTNTFGANRYRLAEHGLEDRVKEINQAGVELLKEVVCASSRDVVIAGDVGPLGVRLAPFGRVHPDQARQAFSEQIEALCASRVDLIIIETISDLVELVEAIKASRENCEFPIVASMTFTRDDRTLFGDTPEKVANTIHGAGADVIGINCSGGPAQILRILQKMRQVVPEARFSVMPNAGWPEQSGGRIMYPAGPDYFGTYAAAFRQAGACLIGGCCGTTPDHIAAMRVVLDSPPIEVQLHDERVASPIKTTAEDIDTLPSQLAQKISQGNFVITVEMNPPRGLSTHKLLAGASLLAEAGADSINVADSPMARMRMSPWAVCNLIQEKIDIETTLHFPTRGRNLLRVQGDLLAAHALGVRNIFVVMGDPTSIGDYPDAMDNYDLVPSGLIKLIKGGFNIGRDHAGAEIGQPTSFYVGGALNLHPQDTDREIKVLHRKVQAGVDFLLTQPVYQPQIASNLIAAYEAKYGPLEVPIIVGVLPLYGSRHAAFLHNEVPGISIPNDIHKRLEDAGKSAPQEGVQMAIELIEESHPWGSGVYIMPAFKRYDLVADIIEAFK